ncbi:probable G-protein coupled receptor Mth-like 1 isoform X1 [Malaya genurostris]|uniref:probable G-protein coupled receptor Mth-like 1 isoform X1 n=1 Tax=Malaya genurostris TaxID=325434 RepID=UPI0026F3CC62|nr:probable G-protein coupled receptor Mth-like 1 isoform X1 [Malaya genurostris]XP_058453500.1 probable G-protein coupled receptor Mth-like 1 isoform X1 [Malaya genurostris]XP_058453502.1 probable G-protein coupled receptor Mth-like 1 isoform X1 [Malaya genurostris]XP_058453503.1 probable G-protein coupled receptor Mth-like 1 isoform X1 [Malaya genurostris]
MKEKRLHLLAVSALPKMCGPLLAGTLLVLFSVSVGAAQRQPVYINKCCRVGEYYDDVQQLCVAGGIEKWVPKVFLPAKNQIYTDVGNAPVHMKFLENKRPEGCKVSAYTTDQILLMGNGSLFLSQKHALVSSPEYCVDEKVALVCARDNGMDSLQAPEKTSSVWRCCGPAFAYDKENQTCVKLDQSHVSYSARIVSSTHVDLSFRFPDCKEHAIAGIFNPDNLQEDTGSVTIDSGKIFASHEYCLEQALDGKTVYVFSCVEHLQPDSVPIKNQDVRFALYSAGLLISVIFLAATLATGYLVTSQHHVLHWRCQTHYVACLLIGDLFLAIVQLSGNSITGPACTMIAIMMHFFFLAAFFWLNTMCFNIWWTFRDLRPTSLEKSQEICRLRIYEVYAWGVPLVIAGVAAILDNLPDTVYLRPRFGERTCWFYGDMEILTYFFGPVGILLCINLLLFASTARQLTCGLWKRDDVKSTTERKTKKYRGLVSSPSYSAALGRVCMKLVVVMGVTWVADVASWVFGGPDYIWLVTDLINALQGVFIFIVVGCQPQVWSAMKRLWNSKTGRSFTNTTHGPQHSSSSHGLPSMGESVTNNTCTNNTTTTTNSQNRVPMETVC